ncbi:MAG TPA: hypothetical protein VNR18_14655 [Hyphomicrobiales bacterium]|nr:hypothetical protein [Hyphomicrobiales bacterium]
MQATEVRNTLLHFCELQLASILDEFDGAVLDAAASAGEGLTLCGDLLGQNANATVPARLRAVLNAIVARLQFHDELSQRSAHLHQLLALVQQPDECLPRDMPQLVALLGSIFSTQAEFALLRRMLPDQPLPPPSTGLELF